MTSNLIKRDVDTAEFLARQGKFWTPCNIDTRGRLYGLPHFSFQREDHVRSLFLFAEGEPIGNELRWLEAAAAGHFGNRRTWEERSDWAIENRELIRAVAADPIGTFDRWREADDPFSLVAVCMELCAAEKGRNYITRFPVLIDGSCNGIQHLALTTRDKEAGRLVNLTDADEIFDLYRTVEDRVRERLAESDDVEAGWWLDRDRLSRALIKTPAMAFSYGITESGAMKKIVEEYKRSFGSEDGLAKRAYYLACLVLQVSCEMLPRPAAAMEYMRGLTDYCTEQGKPLHWISPTGLPIGNRYYKSNTSTVEMKIRGVRVSYRVADGWSSEIVRRAARNSAPANFVHSQDAAHLMRSVNAAAQNGITNVVCVHDCFGSTAPRM
jgi:DNA-directed RNA polymerase